MCSHTHSQTHTLSTYPHLYVNTHTCIHSQTYSYILAHTHTYLHTLTYTSLHTHTHTHTYTHIHIHSLHTTYTHAITLCVKNIVHNAFNKTCFVMESVYVYV